MATFNTAFGSLPGYKEMMGTTNTTAGGEEKTPTVYGGQAQAQRKTQQPAQTFAQMQAQGQARPAAPAAPTATAFGQYGGSQQGQQLRSQLQQRLTEFGQAPSRYDTESFKQIRGAQAANLQAEYQGQKKALDEDLAGRGLYASSIGGGRMGDLAGQQARATASLDAQLLQQAADTQAQDRTQYMQSGQGLAELAGSQDLQQFEANRVGKAAEFEQGLRSAEFGQRQFEQAGQEAFQGAQSEEAASQAARQFDLSAVQQTGGLSLDLQRLLGSQEVERAGLTGQLGGQQTLAGQQQSEQRRQFDLQQTLQQQLGLGGLDVQRGELGVRQQALEQQATDAAAERTLRESLQTRELNAQEKQQLADITSRRELQTQQITEQARQFGININEEQANRLQQKNISTDELAIRRDQVANEFAIQGRQLDETELNNEAIRGLEADKFEADKEFKSDQFGLNKTEVENRALQIKEDQRLKGLEITNEDAYREAEIEARTTQISNDYNIAGRQITTDNARIKAQQDIAAADNLAQGQRLSTQIGASKDEQTRNIQQRLQEFLTQQTGNIYNLGSDGKAVANPGGGTSLGLQELALRKGELTGTFDGATTTQAKQLAFQNAARLSEQSGIQYTVNAAGQPEVVRDAKDNPVKTSADSRTAEELKQRETQFNASLQQRLQEFLTQQTGNIYNLRDDGKSQLAGGTSISGQTASFERAQQQAAEMSRQSGQQYRAIRNDTTGMYTISASDVPYGGKTIAAKDVEAQQQLAQNQLFMQLSNVLSGLNPEQFARLTQGKDPAPPPPQEGDRRNGYIRQNGRWVPDPND